jgi:hypothetical protein
MFANQDNVANWLYRSRGKPSNRVRSSPPFARKGDEDSTVSTAAQDVTIIHNLDFRVFFLYAVSLLQYT